MPVEIGDPSLYTVEPLLKRHNRGDFDCGVESLNRYLKTQARQDARRYLATPIVAVTDDDTVVAYYTLSNNIIDASNLGEGESGRLRKIC